jgi:hypothetical protein
LADHGHEAREKVAAVNIRRRLALLACFSILSFQLLAAQTASQTSSGSTANTSQGKEIRSGALDMILLIDKSLSMASCMEDAKSYIAAKVLGPILVPGDRLIIETVYGKVERLLSVSIASEEDKAKAVRAIRSIKANGRFTDLGAGLDAAKRDLDEMGQPERPKYVLLITDERQEAPKGSPYQATDYKLKHPSLEYVKRTDLGKFRAITVGLQVKAMVEKTAPAVMELLLEPPVRDLAGAATAAGTDAKAGSPASASRAASATGGATAAERALPSWLLYGAAAVFLLAILGLGAVLVVSKRKAREKAAE